MTLECRKNTLDWDKVWLFQPTDIKISNKNLVIDPSCAAPTFLHTHRKLSLFRIK